MAPLRTKQQLHTLRAGGLVRIIQSDVVLVDCIVVFFQCMIDFVHNAFTCIDEGCNRAARMVTVMCATGRLCLRPVAAEPATQLPFWRSWPIHVLSDCSVCSANYTATLAFTCSQCSDGKLAVVVVILAIAFLAALAFVWNMVAIHQEDATLGVAVRVQKVLPLQSIKIIVVVWQIVTQVSTCATIDCATRQQPIPVLHWI